MTCSPFDLRDYLFEELADPQRREVETHLQACLGCREELDRLRLTHTALAALPAEEMPQRIAFVSDKVFQPSPWRRWLAAFWASSARLGFASAAMLSVALLVTAYHRPAPAPAPVASVKTISDTEIRQRIEAGVTRAVADIEARYAQRTEQLVKDIERRDREERRTLQASAEEEIDYLRHSLQVAQHRELRASVGGGE